MTDYSSLLMDIAEKAAEDHGIDVQFEVMKDVGQAAYKLRMYKYVVENGEKMKYGAETSVTESALLDSGSMNLFEQQVERTVHEMRQKLSEEYNVNGHELVVYRKDGFHAHDRVTGEQWAVTPEEAAPYLAPSQPMEVGVGVPQADWSRFEEERLPKRVKNRLLEYVLGWAAAFSADEVMEMRARGERVPK